MDLPANSARYCLETDKGYTIEVSSLCTAQVRRLASDFSLALEYGAVPAVQACMIDAVQAYEEREIPLQCVLSFGV